MSHLNDDELVLHYYGEDGTAIVAAERHLQSCARCAREYEALARTLGAIMPPEFSEIPDELPALRALIRDRLREQVPPPGASRSVSREQAALAAAVWLIPFLYPFSFQALFNSARLAEDHIAGLPLVALALAWAFAGPFVAVLALNRMGSDRRERSTRFLIGGAMAAAISPALFVMLSLVRPGLSLWYGAVSAGLVLALVEWPTPSHSSARLLSVHRLSAVVITVFAVAHIVNQALGFVSVASYTMMRDVLRVGYQQPAVAGLLMASVAIQVATGAGVGMRKVRAGAFSDNLQAVSGWYLAAFLLTHVFSGLLLRQPPTAPTMAASATQFTLLASAHLTAQLPFLLLGVVAFLFHVGAYARLTAMAFLAEASVRRLSYAGMFVGTTVVLTIGLALCGIHVIR